LCIVAVIVVIFAVWSGSNPSKDALAQNDNGNPVRNDGKRDLSADVERVKNYHSKLRGTWNLLPGPDGNGGGLIIAFDGKSKVTEWSIAVNPKSDGSFSLLISEPYRKGLVDYEISTAVPPVILITQKDVKAQPVEERYTIVEIDEKRMSLKTNRPADTEGQIGHYAKVSDNPDHFAEKIPVKEKPTDKQQKEKADLAKKDNGGPEWNPSKSGIPLPKAEPKKNGLARFKSGKHTLTLRDMLYGKQGSPKTRRDETFNRDYQTVPVEVAEKRQTNSDCLVLVFHVTSGFMPTVEGGGKCVLVANSKKHGFISTAGSPSADYKKGLEMLLPTLGWLSIICTQQPVDEKGQPINIVLIFELPPTGSTCRLEGLKEFPSIEITVP